MDGNKHVYHLYVVRVKGDGLGVKSDKVTSDKVTGDGLGVKSEELRVKSENKEKLRDKLAKFLGEKGVATGLHYPLPLHLQPCFEHLGYKKGDMPVTEDLADTCLSLPMFPEITEEMVAYVAECVKEYFSVKS